MRKRKVYTGHVYHRQNLGLLLEFFLPHPIPKVEEQPGVAGAPKRERRKPEDTKNTYIVSVSIH